MNYLQVTAIAVAIDAQWTFTMVALFQTAGEQTTTLSDSFMTRGVFCRVRRRHHIGSRQSICRLSCSGRIAFASLDNQYAGGCSAADCMHPCLRRFMAGDQDQTQQVMDVPAEEMYPQRTRRLLRQLYLHHQDAHRHPKLRRSP